MTACGGDQEVLTKTTQGLLTATTQTIRVDLYIFILFLLLYFYILSHFIVLRYYGTTAL